MNGKAFKWLQETLHYPPNLHLLLKHPKHKTPQLQQPSFPPHLPQPPRICSTPNFENVAIQPFVHNSNLTSTQNTSWTTHRGQQLQFPSQPNPPNFKQSFLQNILCASFQNVDNSSSTPWGGNNSIGGWENNHTNKHTLHQKGRAWSPPGLEGGQDGSNTNDVKDFLEDNFGNDTYPDYGLYNYYDYDQSNWLSNHLDELYEIMRSSQIDISIALTVFLAIVFLFGVTGNILVLVVFSKGVVQQQASTVFIKALAVTDLIICLVVLPGVLLKEWYIPYRYDAICQGWELIRCSTIPLSTLILASVAVDRYVKICRVDRSIQISNTTAKKILLATALISICLGLPPMLRMGVYQAGDGPNAPNVYLGLCMGNDLLVSKATVDSYWQAMAAAFLLVLILVMVMYGLVFRTVYKQSRRWGKWRGGTGKEGGRKGGERGGGGTKSKETEQQRQQQQQKRCINCSGGCAVCGGCENKGYSHDDNKDEDDVDVVKDNRKRGCHCGKANANNIHPKSRGHGNKYYNKRRTTIKTLESKKKRSAWTLSFLCGNSKRRGSDDEEEQHPVIKLSNQNQEEVLHDDGVTSLDDGHMSYLNTPSTSSQHQQQSTMATNKKGPRSAIFSCTSQLVVSKSAYISKKSYYHQKNSDWDCEEEDTEKETKFNKGLVLFPKWLLRWKRLVKKALFTTAAQKEEDKRSAKKLALRQKAKIKMMNQEASCDIDGNSTTLQANNIISQIDSANENTLTTKITTTNPVSSQSFVAQTTETNNLVTKRTKMNSSQSLDLGISHMDKDETLTGHLFQINRITNREQSTVKDENYLLETNQNTLGVNRHIQQQCSVNILHDSSADDVPITNHGLEEQISKEMTCNNINRQREPSENSIFNDQPITNRNFLKLRTGRRRSKSDGDEGQEQNSGAMHYFILPNTTHHLISTEKDGYKTSVTSHNGDCDRKLNIEGPFIQAWPTTKTTYSSSKGTNTHQMSLDTGSDVKHQNVINSVSCPLPFKIVNKSGNKVHPLTSPFFSTSDPNIIAATKSFDGLSHDDNEKFIAGANKKWVFYSSECHENYEAPKSQQGLTANNTSNDRDKFADWTDSIASKTDDKEDQEVNNMRKMNHKSKQTDIEFIGNPGNLATGTLKLPTNAVTKGNTENGRKIKINGGKTGGESSSKAPVASQRERGYNRAQVKTAQVLFLVTVVYVLSFAPVLLMSVEAVPSHPIPFYGYFIHSAANPILYSFINEAFRHQLYHLLCPHCCGNK